MYFESWQAFWTMGGHGPYVWSAYAITFVVLVGLVVAPWLRGRRLRRDQLAARAREARRTGSAS